MFCSDMPPKSARARMRSGGMPPPSSKPSAPLPAASAAHDSTFDFLDGIPSPVTFTSSQPPRPNVSSSQFSSSHTQVAALPPPAPGDDGDQYAFMASIPSPVVPSSSSRVGETGIATSSASVRSTYATLPPPSQLGRLRARAAADDARASLQSHETGHKVRVFSLILNQVFGYLIEHLAKSDKYSSRGGM